MNRFSKYVVLLEVIFVIAVFSWFGYQATINPSVAQAQQSWPRPPFTVVNVNFSTATNQTLVPAATGNVRICVYGMVLVNAGASATTISIYQDGGTTPVTTALLAPSGGAISYTLRDNPENPFYRTNAATGFVVGSSVANQVNGGVWYGRCQ